MSDDTTKKIIERITVTYPEPTKLPSGHLSTTFFNCIQLTPNELARLAAQAIGDLEADSFDLVVGVAYTGILFASALAGGREVVISQVDGRLFGPDVKNKRVIVADDVICSANRVEKVRSVVENFGGKVIAWACIIDRSDGQTDKKGLPIFSAYQAPI